MNSRFERSAISALCVGVLFCLGVVTTLAQDPPNGTAQDPSNGTAQPCGQPCALWDPCPAQPCATPPCPVANPCPQPCATPCATAVSHGVKKGRKESAESAEVFRKIAVLRDKVPQDILCKAQAIGVFSGVFNVAYIGGYRQGNGAITVRTTNGWTAPVFYKMKGGSFGLQIGVQSTDFLLIFMSRDSIHDLADGEFDLSLDANAVAGPVFGARGSVGHPDFPKGKTVFVYARSKGLFAGAVIDGAKLYARNKVNRDLYSMNARDLLTDPPRLPSMCASCLPQGVADFPQAVAAAIPTRMAAQPVVAVVVQPQPQPETPVAQEAPPEQPAPKRVIEIKEEEVIVVEEQPQKQMPRASKRRRAHKMKR